MAEEKLKILYLMQMLLEETDPAHPMNATQLCERMQSRYEYSYNRKTIYTDIKRLQTYGMTRIIIWLHTMPSQRRLSTTVWIRCRRSG